MLETVQCTSLSERAVFSVDSVACVSFDSDGERIISASLSGFVRIWDAHFESKEEQGGVGHSERWLAFVSVAMECEWRLDRMTERCDCGMRRRVRNLGHPSKVIQEE